jgi:hypothetical protein
MRSHERTPPFRTRGRCTLSTSLPSGKHSFRTSFFSGPFSEMMAQGYLSDYSGCDCSQNHELASSLWTRRLGGCMGKVQLPRWNPTSRVALSSPTAFARGDLRTLLVQGKTQSTRQFVPYAMERPKKPSWYFLCYGFPQTKCLATRYHTLFLWQRTDLHDSL